MPQAIKSPEPVGAGGAHSNSFKSNITLVSAPLATDQISHPMLRSAAVHWDYAEKGRREMYLRYLQIIPRAELDNWTALNFSDFEHSSQLMIFGAIACCCSDLFHLMVKQGAI